MKKYLLTILLCIIITPSYLYGLALKTEIYEDSSLNIKFQKKIDILSRLRVSNLEVSTRIKDNTPIELIVFNQLKTQFSTPEQQKAEITRLINEFGSKPYNEVKMNILKIMCLGQLLFESVDKAIHITILIEIMNKERPDNSKSIMYFRNLNYLEKRIESFRPIIYKKLKEYFAKKYTISEDLVYCLPKTMGREIGAKIIIPDSENPGNFIIYHVKTHQEFHSKDSSHFYGIQTSNVIKSVDLKELFMYKLLKKIGYGPKIEFIVNSNMPYVGGSLDLMLATKDLAYTKNPLEKEKTFNTFNSIKDTFLENSIEDTTRIDFIVIEMISRIFLLEDVLVNEGNFGRVDVYLKQQKIQKLSKWKIVDFLPPIVKKNKQYLGESKYLCKFYFRSRRSYNSSIDTIFEDAQTKLLWNSAAEILKKGRSENKIGIEEAIEKSYQEIMSFLEINRKILKLEKVDGVYKEQTLRRIEDLTIFKKCVLQNFNELIAELIIVRDSA